MAEKSSKQPHLSTVNRMFAHFETIKQDRGKFVLWCLTSVILSLSSVWLPSLLGAIVGVDLFSKQMQSNPFILFSIVFLSNSVLTSINTVGAGSNRFAVTMRGITLVFVIFYLLLLSTIIPIKLLMDISLSLYLQTGFLILTVFLGIYVYGFRETQWEKSVDDARKEQDSEIDIMASDAISVSDDGSGVKL